MSALDYICPREMSGLDHVRFREIPLYLFNQSIHIAIYTKCQHQSHDNRTYFFGHEDSINIRVFHLVCFITSQHKEQYICETEIEDGEDEIFISWFLLVSFLLLKSVWEGLKHDWYRQSCVERNNPTHVIRLKATSVRKY